MRLGELSAKYESNGYSGTISDGYLDAGGVSYGAYQFASNAGVPQAFVQWLINRGENYGCRMNQYEVGSSEFNNEWKSIAKEDSEGFFELQHQYIYEKYYVPAISRANDAYIDLESRSFALQNAIWSAAVQYGPYYVTELFQDAADILGYPNASYANDRELILAIYDVRKSDEWTAGSPGLRYGLRRRFTEECQDVLNMLQGG